MINMRWIVNIKFYSLVKKKINKKNYIRNYNRFVFKNSNFFLYNAFNCKNIYVPNVNFNI